MTGHPAWGAFPAVGQVALIGHVGASQFVNTQHFSMTAGIDPATSATALSALLVDWNTSVRPAFLAALPSDYVLDTIRGTIVAVAGLAHPSFASVDQVPTTTAGTFGPTAAGAFADAMVIKMRTALGGKHHRGRNYFGPLPQGNQFLDGKLANATLISAINAYIVALNRYLPTGAAVANFQMCVFHRPVHAGGRQWAVRVGGALTVRSNPTAEAGEATPVNQLVLDLVGRELRRREFGVGA